VCSELDVAFSWRFAGNQLLVSAKHEQKDDEMTEYREFNRRIDLPPNVLPESVTSTLSSDGVLSISAPVQMPAVEAGTAEQQVSELRYLTANCRLAYARIASDLTMRETGTDMVPLRLEYRITLVLFAIIQAASTDVQSLDGGQQQNAVIAKDPAALATPQRGPSAYFAFQLPVRGFRPEEIKVETKDRIVCVSGTHETKGEGHESRVSFRKEYLLPPNADKDKLNVYIKDGRRLIVEAPIASGEQQQAASVHVLAVEHK